jgi:CRP-like cAMP-binding protein
VSNDALVYKLIHTVRLFAGFEVPEARAFLSACKLETHHVGTRLIKQGETSYELYVMLSGEVAVRRESEGGETELARLGPGDTFGELALLDFGARSASIDVLSETRVFVAERAAIFRLSSLEGKLYRNLAIMMATRLRETDAMLGRMSTKDATPEAFEKLALNTQKFFVG